MKKILTLLFGGLLSAAVSAAPLLPGTTLDNPLIPNATPDYTTGAVPVGGFTLVTTLVSPYAGTGFGGEATTTVWRNPVDNTLTFQYHFTNVGLSLTRDLIRATIGDVSQPWAGYAITDAGSDGSGSSTDGGGAGINWTDGDPAFLLRDPVGSGEGLTIQWRDNSNGTVLRNTSSDFSALIWFATDATDYQLTDIGLLDSGLIGSAQGYAPLATYVIPEPTSLALFGLLGLGLIRRRR